MKSVGDIGTLSSKWDVPIKPPLKAQGFVWKRRCKDYNSQMWGMSPGKWHLPDIEGLLYIWTHRKLWQHVQGLHRFKSDRFPGLGGRNGHGVPLLIQKLCYFIILLKIIFPLVWVSSPSSIPNIHSLFIYPKFSGYFVTEYI